jgi:hypothetical protein
MSNFSTSMPNGKLGKTAADVDTLKMLLNVKEECSGFIMLIK